MNTRDQNCSSQDAVEAILRQLERLYPGGGLPDSAGRLTARPHIATMEARPQHPHAMDAALTATTELLTRLSRQMRSRFADARRCWQADDDLDWRLVQAALSRLFDSDAYLQLAESQAIALGAADTGDPATDDKYRLRNCRLILVQADQNALRSIEHDSTTLTANTGHSVAHIRNSRRHRQPGKQSGHRAAGSIVIASRQTLNPAIDRLRTQATILRRWTPDAASQGTPE